MEIFIYFFGVVLPLLFICFVCLRRLRVDVDTPGNFEEEGFHQDQDQHLDLFQGKSYLDHIES